MSDFYTRLFGWRTQQLGPEMGNYVVVRATETSKDGMIREPGRINGGFTENSKGNAVAGGKLLAGHNSGRPDEIPGVSLYASFINTEGNRVGVLQPYAYLWFDMEAGKAAELYTSVFRTCGRSSRSCWPR